MFLFKTKQLEIEMTQSLDTMQNNSRYIANKATEDQSMIIQSTAIKLHQTYL